MRRLLSALLQRIPGPDGVAPARPPSRAPAQGLGRRRWLASMAWLLLAGATAPAPALAQGVELSQLQVRRVDGGLVLDYNARLTLTPQIEEALQRGVPLYFVAQAQVLRSRWYWRDERVARQVRSWRLSYQPLTASWRISLGGLSQVYATLSEALAPLSRVSGWRLVEPGTLEPGERYQVEYSFQLDNSQLPRPMQIDLGGDWKLGVERNVRVD
jgi:hypothetical protein